MLFQVEDTNLFLHVEDLGLLGLDLLLELFVLVVQHELDLLQLLRLCECRVPGSGLRNFRVSGLEFRVSVLGFRVSDLGSPART